MATSLLVFLKSLQKPTFERLVPIVETRLRQYTPYSGIVDFFLFVSSNGKHSATEPYHLLLLFGMILLLGQFLPIHPSRFSCQFSSLVSVSSPNAGTSLSETSQLFRISGLKIALRPPFINMSCNCPKVRIFASLYHLGY